MGEWLKYEVGNIEIKQQNIFALSQLAIYCDMIQRLKTIGYYKTGFLKK